MKKKTAYETCKIFQHAELNKPGLVAQWVTCLATDACLTTDPETQVRSRPGPGLSLRLIIK